MPHPIPFLVLPSVILLSSQPASACEPIMVWVVLAGPHWLSMSIAGLFAVIAAKCLAFTFLARDIDPIRRPGYMLLGNVVSSVVGFVVALPLAAPSLLILFLAPILIAGISVAPTSRVREALGFTWVSNSWAVYIVSLGILVTIVFYGLAMGALDANAVKSYWALKILYIAAAFGVSVFVTVLFEEWTIWKLADGSASGKNWLAPVLHANLFAFLIAGGIAASIMLPKRMRSPNFLVDLMETLRAAFA